MISRPIRLLIVKYLLGLWRFFKSPRVEDSRSQEALIRRDTWGVPHIIAPTEAAAAFAHGYVTAEDHFLALARLLLRARGEQATYFGEKSLAEDEAIAQVEIYEVARKAFAGLPPLTQIILNNYADGYNLYLSRRRRDAPEWAIPITGVDILAHCRAVMLFDFLPFHQSATQYGQSDTEQSPPGSNMWAIGRELSTTGRGLLLANPHLGWEGSYIFHEVHITVPGRINVCGATLIGFPVITIGFNEYLGWAHTINKSWADDIYELTLDPRDENRYLYDGESLALKQKVVTLRVKKSNGVESVTRKFFFSHYGPTVKAAPGRAYALKSPNLAAVDFLTQWNRMAKAKSLAEFRAALNMQAIPMFNLGYADAEGNVFYLFNGRIPWRAPKYQCERQLAPGNTSESEWFDILPISELPHLENPKGGYIQNCNDAPWYVNLRENLSPGLYQPNLSPDGLGFRGQFSLRLLESDSKLDLQQIIGFKFDDRILVAERVITELLELIEDKKSQRLEWDTALNVLREWDGRAAAESRGAVLFSRWWEEYFQSAKPAFKLDWDASEPLTTPRGIGDSDQALNAFGKIVDELLDEYGNLGIAWGEVHRLRRGDRDLPLSGNQDCFRTIRYRHEKGGKRTPVYGDSFVMAVEFAETPIAYSVMAYSQSSDPDSPHFADQSALFATNQMKRIWFTEEDIEINLERVYRPRQ
jgi:acyl-homoserine-lactone acylase